MQRTTKLNLVVGLTAIAAVGLFAVGVLTPDWLPFGRDSATMPATTATTAPAPKPPATNTAAASQQPMTIAPANVTPWVAAAPGRIEPRSGEIRVAAAAAGRIVEVRVVAGEMVEDGDLLVRLEDDEARARLDAAEAEAAARRRERDAGPLVAGRDEVRRSEDIVAASERSLFQARIDVDAQMALLRSGKANEAQLTEMRKRLADARDKLQKDRDALRTAQAKPALPVANRLETALTVARAEIATAEALAEKTKIRSPLKGSVLQLNAKVGESAGGDLPLVTVGDLSLLRAKVELDERDVAKVKVGQKVILKADAFPGKEFEGQVVLIAPTLAPPRMALRSARRPSDVDVLEVTIELAPGVALVPGMRADVFFRPLP